MPLPAEYLPQVARSDESPLNRLQRAVETVATARQPGSEPLTKINAVELLDAATTGWLAATHGVVGEFTVG